VTGRPRSRLGREAICLTNSEEPCLGPLRSFKTISAEKHNESVQQPTTLFMNRTIKPER